MLVENVFQRFGSARSRRQASRSRSPGRKVDLNRAFVYGFNEECSKKSLLFTLIIFDVKKESSKNKMADPLEGLYIFIRPNRAGITDSGERLARSQGVPLVLCLQDYDLVLKQPSPTPAYAVTAAVRARKYLTSTTAAEAWDMIENHEPALVAVRDLSHG